MKLLLTILINLSVIVFNLGADENKPNPKPSPEEITALINKFLSSDSKEIKEGQEGLLKIGSTAFPFLREVVEKEPSLSDTQRKEIEQLITELGADDWRTSEKAQEKLIQIGVIALPFLEKAQTNPEPEIRMRIKQILKEIDVFQPDRNRIKTAKLLVKTQDKEVVKSLIGLLKHDSQSLRLSAYYILKKLITKDRPEFEPDASKDKRKESIAQWEQWWEKNKDTFQIDKDIKFKAGGLNPGNTLICIYHPNGRVIEVDHNGKTVWEFKSNGPTCARWLENGNILIAEHLGNRVIEVDRDGKVVWEYKPAGGFPWGAGRLSNDNTVIGARGSAIMVDKDGTLLRTLAEFPPLPGGGEIVGNVEVTEKETILVTTTYNPSGVREFNQKGEEIWKQLADGSPHAVQRLENANTLVGTVRAVIELDPDGKEVWRYNGANCRSVQRLANGNTLITSWGPSHRVFEVDPSGKEVWSFPLPAGDTAMFALRDDK